MPGKNNNNQNNLPQIDEFGFIDVGEVEKEYAQVMADLNRTTRKIADGATLDPVLIDGAPTSEEFTDSVNRSCHKSDRLPSTTSMFYFYLMAEKGLSFEEMIQKIPPKEKGGEAEKEYHDYLTDYWKFVKDNPIQALDKEGKKEPPISADKRKQSIANWANMYSKCANKFAEYRFPNIDYSKGSEVAKHLKELYFFSNIMQDFQQNMESFMLPNSVDTRIASGSYDKMYLDARNWCGLQGFAYGLDKAFFTKPGNNKNRKLTAAVNRTALRNFTPTVAGKTSGEMQQNAIKLMHQSMDLINVQSDLISGDLLSSPEMMNNPNLKTAVINQVLRGEAHPGFEHEAENLLHQTQEKTITRKNCKVTCLVTQEFQNRLGGMPGYVANKAAVDRLFEGNPSPQESYNRLKELDDGKYINRLNELFHDFELEGMATFREAAGVEFMDTIRIDGKTPMELWGEKYSFIKNPVERQVMFQAEVLHEYFHGTSEITADIYLADENYKPVMHQIAIAKSPITIKRGFDLLDRITEYHNKIHEDLRNFANAENARNDEDRQRCLFQPEIKRLQDAMIRVYETSDVNDAHKGLFSDFHKALKEYEEASKDYLQKVKDNNGLAVSGDQNNKSETLRRAEQKRLEMANNGITECKDIAADIHSECQNFGILISDKNDPLERGIFVFTTFKDTLNKEIQHRSLNLLDFLNKKFYHEEDFAWAKKTPNNNPWNKDISELGDGKFEFLEKENNLGFLDNVADNFGSIGRELMPTEKKVQKDGKTVDFSLNQSYFHACGLSYTREDSVLSMFCLWMMAEKNCSLETIAKMTSGPVKDVNGKVTNQEYIDQMRKYQPEFVKFCKDHPVIDVKDYKGEDFEVNIQCKKTKEGYAADVKAWTDMLSKATSKMKEYRIPVLDYSDKNQVKRLDQELFLIGELALNFSQETPKIFVNDHPGKSTLEFAYDAMGGEANYRKMAQDWINIQSIIYPVSMGYYTPVNVNKDRTFGYYMGNALAQAKYRMSANVEMAPYKGKTLGEASNHFEGQAIASSEVQTTYYNSEEDQEKRTGLEEFNPLPVIGFLSGRNRREFKEKEKKKYLEARDKAPELIKVSTEDMVAGLMSFELTTEQAWVERKLKSMGNDPREMTDLINQKSEKKIVDGQEVTKENSALVRYMFLTTLENKIGDKYKSILGAKGMKLTDLFLIDGQSPEQKWGEKYRDVPEDDKYVCYLGEISRSLLTANARVQIRHFELKPDGKLEEAEPYTAMESMETLSKDIDNAACLKFTTEELKRELESLQRDFLLTQEDKSANRYHENHGEEDKRTGTDLYQNMTVALDRCIKDLKPESNIKPNVLLEHLNTLEQASNTYYRERYGLFFRPLRDYGKKRLTASGKTNKIVAAFKARINIFRNNLLDSNLFAVGQSLNAGTKPTLLKDASFKEMETFVKKASTRKEREDTKEEVAQKYAKAVKDDLANRIDQDFANAPENEMENRAWVQLYGMKNDVVGHNTITVSDVRRLDRFEENMEKLSKNPLFNRFYEISPVKCRRDWNEIEKRADANKEKIAEDHLRIKKSGTYAQFVTTPVNAQYVPGRPLNEERIEELRHQTADTLRGYGKKVNSIYIHAKERKEAYRQLSKVLILQILDEDSTMGRRILQSIGADELAHERNNRLSANKTVKKLTASVYRYFEGKKVLDGGDVEGFLKKLDNGELVKDVKKHLETQFKTEMSRIAETQNPGLQVADPEENNQPHIQPVHGMGGPH